VTILSEILERKRAEVSERRKARPDRELEVAAKESRPTKSLFSALSSSGGPSRLIAEVKRASPSAGSINSQLDAGSLAAQYALAGASAISVLTDGPGFGGSLADLTAVRGRVQVPLLRKDFIVDRYQLLEAREHGADAVLLIAAALERESLRSLHREASGLGLEVLFEVHEDRELDLALDCGARVIGINNRDLKSFKIDLATSERLLPRIPLELRAVAESGIRGLAELRRLRTAGAANFLIGEALVRASDPGGMIREFLAVQ
jgi:indole-3-glycerol phosphate synthase